MISIITVRSVVKLNQSIFAFNIAKETTVDTAAATEVIKRAIAIVPDESFND